LRSLAPSEVSTGDIYRGIVPFVGRQLLALLPVFAFPGLATWLPNAIGWSLKGRCSARLDTG